MTHAPLSLAFTRSRPRIDFARLPSLTGALWNCDPIPQRHCDRFSRSSLHLQNGCQRRSSRPWTG